MLSYILEYVDETDPFDEEGTHESYRRIYHALKQGNFPMMHLYLDQLRCDLREKRLLHSRKIDRTAKIITRSMVQNYLASIKFTLPAVIPTFDCLLAVKFGGL